MSVADVKARSAFLSRFKPHQRVTVAEYGQGTIRGIAGNFAYIACDQDGPFADDRTIAGCRIIMFDRIEAVR